jgi:pyrroloquinoline quinone (PQQ) biosynthesis protein C
MNRSDWQSRMDAIIARYDLRMHPFYQAWAVGRLRAEDLSGDESSAESVFAAVEEAAVVLWKSLDGIHQLLSESAAA